LGREGRFLVVGHTKSRGIPRIGFQFLFQVRFSSLLSFVLPLGACGGCLLFSVGPAGFWCRTNRCQGWSKEGLGRLPDLLALQSGFNFTHCPQQGDSSRTYRFLSLGWKPTGPNSIRKDRASCLPYRSLALKLEGFFSFFVFTLLGHRLVTHRMSTNISTSFLLGGREFGL